MKRVLPRLPFPLSEDRRKSKEEGPTHKARLLGPVLPKSIARLQSRCVVRRGDWPLTILLLPSKAPDGNRGFVAVFASLEHGDHAKGDDAGRSRHSSALRIRLLR